VQALRRRMFMKSGGGREVGRYTGDLVCRSQTGYDILYKLFRI